MKDVNSSDYLAKRQLQPCMLLVIPNPLSDELLSSWLVRMAFEHHRLLPTFMHYHIGYDIEHFSSLDLDFKYDESLFDKLSSKTRFSLETIKTMSLRSQEGQLFICDNCLDPPKQIRRQINKQSHYGQMFCPKCLAEDTIPYWRKQWRYHFYNICPKHKIFLADRCGNCYRRIQIVKMNSMKELVYCPNCKRDLRLTISPRIPLQFEDAIEAVKWFETGLDNGYFVIGGTQVKSLWIFQAYTRLRWLLDRGEKLILQDFSILEDYKLLCKQLLHYNSKKGAPVYKNFFLNAMVCHLFQNFPTNLIQFAHDNHLTHREFTHALKGASFWYKEMLFEHIPPQNKIGREISESEVLGAINYMKKHGMHINQFEVAKMVGCHFTIHKGFKRIYKNIQLIY